ncbi:MAG: hypothetical protein MO846_08940 [Candidatus Devosia symbiotica]|nr:hypothetical protein [Candidatus Devosia symbiotica]
MAGVVMAEPAQCTASGFGTFDCDVTRDGGGLTFAVPDGQVFAFGLADQDKGLVYLNQADAGPGTYPQELGAMMPSADAPGCWVGGKDSFAFCVLVAR